MVFVCSPVADEEKKLVSLAKKMKKGNIDVDFILFGEIDDDVQKKLEAFNNVVKGSDSSHFIVAPADGRLLSDQLLSTPILLGEGAAAGGAGGAGGGGGGGDFGDFDFDPSTDPELALALRMSMEEENARQAKEAKAKEDAGKSNLEGIQEEDEAQPLLNQQDEPSGSGSGSGSSGDKKDDKKDGGDKMDTS